MTHLNGFQEACVTMAMNGGKPVTERGYDVFGCHGEVCLPILNFPSKCAHVEPTPREPSPGQSQ